VAVIAALPAVPLDGGGAEGLLDTRGAPLHPRSTAAREMRHEWWAIAPLRVMWEG
jgi:hypothetical protein